MATKQQTIHFQNADGKRTARINLVLDRKMDNMPLFYQLILHQDKATIFASQQKWDQWKRCLNEKMQMNFLHRHVWTYEPGKLKPELQEKFQRILDMADMESI
jgi:hypothetical protein